MDNMESANNFLNNIVVTTTNESYITFVGFTNDSFTICNQPTIHLEELFEEDEEEREDENDDSDNGPPVKFEPFTLIVENAQKEEEEPELQVEPERTGRTVRTIPIRPRNRFAPAQRGIQQQQEIKQLAKQLAKVDMNRGEYSLPCLLEDELKKSEEDEDKARFARELRLRAFKEYDSYFQ